MRRRVRHDRDWLRTKKVDANPKLKLGLWEILTDVMKKHTEVMTDYCEYFATEEEAIAVCREVNPGLSSKYPACCVVVDGPEDNYAVVDLETAKELLDFDGETELPCFVVTEFHPRRLLAVSAKTKSDSHDKVLVVQQAAKSCRKEARRDDNSRKGDQDQGRGTGAR